MLLRLWNRLKKFASACWYGIRYFDCSVHFMLIEQKVKLIESRNEYVQSSSFYLHAVSSAGIYEKGI